MHELKKMERYLRVNLLGPGPLLMKKRIYLAAVSQRLRNSVLDDRVVLCETQRKASPIDEISV